MKEANLLERVSLGYISQLGGHMRLETSRSKRNISAALVIAVSAAVALPMLLFPVGMGRNTPANILVGKAYAKTFPDDTEQEEILIEDYALPASVAEDSGESTNPQGLIQVGEGETVSASYLEGMAPAGQENYEDVYTAAIVPYVDEDQIPVEILDPETFTPIDKKNYIQTTGTIIKEKPVMSSVTLATINKGQGVARVSDGESWSLIRTDDGVEGYVPTYCLSEEMVIIDIDRTVWVKVDGATLRQEPSTFSAALDTLPEDTRLVCSEIADTWYKVTTPDGQVGYVSVSLTTQTPPPTPTPVPTPTPTSAPQQVSQNSASRSSGSSGGGSSSRSNRSSSGGGSSSQTTGDTSKLPNITGVNGSSIASICESMLGVPYVWASASRSGVDCSGLIVYAYRQIGIELPHQSNSLKNSGVSVSRADIAVGDVVCWAIYSGSDYSDHVGIYVGGGSVIHASSSRSQVMYGSLDMGTIVSIRRIIS